MTADSALSLMGGSAGADDGKELQGDREVMNQAIMEVAHKTAVCSTQ